MQQGHLQTFTNHYLISKIYIPHFHRYFDKHLPCLCISHLTNGVHVICAIILIFCVDLPLEKKAI